MLLSKLMLKLILIMGAGVVLSLPVPAINRNKLEKVIIKQDNYIYQINKYKGQIDRVYVFERDGDPVGVFEYDELETKHRKAVNQVIK